MNTIEKLYFCLELLVGKTMTTTLQETNFSLVSRKSVGETWNSLLGITTEDVHCTNKLKEREKRTERDRHIRVQSILLVSFFSFS
jgi:hypothetical protein